MKILAVLAVAGALALVAAGPGSATTWTEDFESYALGNMPVVPNSPWFMDTVAYTGYTATSGKVITRTSRTNVTTNKAWKPGAAGTPNEASRIGRAIGQPIGSGGIVVDGWFYSAGTGTSKRNWVGLADFNQTTNTFNTNSALVRIGGNNLATYQVHYYDTALHTIDTGLATNLVGWYYVKLTMSYVSGTNWRCDWQINPYNGSPTTGNVTFAWGASLCDSVCLGYNYGTSVEMDWDDISMSVPEPGSLLALATGLVGLVGILRRRA